MLRRLKIAWHKSRALSALQVYFDQPLKEPLPAHIESALNGLSKLALQDGAKPVDTALRYYRIYAEQVVVSGQSLDSIGFFGVMGRMFGLRDKQAFYREHHEALIAIGEAEQAKDKQA